eukprot:4544981-Heterocapsa_arctica.AAC.1
MQVGACFHSSVVRQDFITRVAWCVGSNSTRQREKGWVPSNEDQASAEGHGNLDRGTQGTNYVSLNGGKEKNVARDRSKTSQGTMLSY